MKYGVLKIRRLIFRRMINMLCTRPTAILNRIFFFTGLHDGQIFNITNTGVSETNPSWSPDGKYIYFSSDRTHPSYPYGPQNEKIFRMPLEKIAEPYRSDMFDSLFVKKKTETAKPDTSTKEKKKEYANAKKEKKDGNR